MPAYCCNSAVVPSQTLSCRGDSSDDGGSMRPICSGPFRQQQPVKVWRLLDQLPTGPRRTWSRSKCTSKRPDRELQRHGVAPHRERPRVPRRWPCSRSRPWYASAASVPVDPTGRASGRSGWPSRGVAVVRRPATTPGSRHACSRCAVPTRCSRHERLQPACPLHQLVVRTRARPRQVAATPTSACRGCRQ